MTIERFYPVGTPGRPWTEEDKETWLRERRIQRSYREEVVDRLDRLGPPFAIEQYGALSLDPERYRLLAVESTLAGSRAPWALVTGGVHGYETSGVRGALEFLERHALDYAERLNLLVVPCVSPWGYEVIDRWNPRAIDPNRSFREDSPCEESAALMGCVGRGERDFLVHIDLHETTDTDESEFRPALAARDGKPFEPGHVPDGFYTVGDTENPEPAFQAAIVAAVEKVTHIAPPDAEGRIIGSEVTQRGVIDYPCRALGLCASVSGARYVSTTEVYPDSDEVTPEVCVAAQIAAVRAALDHALEPSGSSSRSG